MKAHKLSKLIALFMGSISSTAAWSHPGHQHGQGVVDRLLHAVQTEWLAPLALLVLVLGTYAYVKKGKKD